MEARKDRDTLHEALDSEDFDKVSELVQAGHKVDKSTAEAATEIGAANVVELFLNQGGSFTNYDPFKIAVKRGYIPLARLLLDKHGSQIMYQEEEESERALFTACKNVNWEMAELLLEYSDRLSDNLIFFIHKKDNDTVEGLVDGGVTMTNLTAHIAIQKGILPAVKTFLKINGFLPKDTSYVLRVAAEWGQEDVVKYALANGADPNCPVPTQATDTALHYASRHGNTQIVKLLINAGANPNLRSRGCRTALSIAAARNYSEIVSILLLAGADKDQVWKYILNIFSNYNFPY